MSIQKTAITASELEKIHRDLHFIDLITKQAKTDGMRVIIHGGYAVDGLLGQLTRPHGDIDLGIWGNQSDGPAAVQNLLSAVQRSDPSFSSAALDDKGRHEWYHTFVIREQPSIKNKAALYADTYYIQVTGDPFAAEKRILKADGSVAEPQMHSNQIVTLEGITFESISAMEAILDRRHKREAKGEPIKPHHTQDIANLQLLTNDEEVEKKLTSYQR